STTWPAPAGQTGCSSAPRGSWPTTWRSYTTSTSRRPGGPPSWAWPSGAPAASTTTPRCWPPWPSGCGHEPGHEGVGHEGVGHEGLSMGRYAVIGGGIAGLAAAHELTRLDPE